MADPTLDPNSPPAPLSPERIAQGFVQTNLQAPIGGTPSTPAVATNPYDVAKILGPTPDLAAAFGPAPVRGQTQITPINDGTIANRWGHIATTGDIQAHRDAREAAAAYLQAASHIHTLHNETQKDIDTASTLHGLIGFDYAHPEAEKNLSTILAANPNYDPSKIHPILDLGRQQATAKAQLQKTQAIKPLADVKDIATLDTAIKGADKNLTSSDFLPSSPDWTAKDASGKVVSMEDPTASTFSKKYKDQKNVEHNTAPVSRDQFFTFRAYAMNPTGTQPAATLPAKPGEKGFKPTVEQEQQFRTQHTAAVQWAKDNSKDPRAAKILALNNVTL